MFVLIGLAIIAISILGGFMMEGGKVMALMQFTEFIIIGGAGLGSMLIANPLPSVMAMVKSVIGLLKGNPFTKERYMELLKMLYDIFMMARREGLVSLDQHVEKPGTAPHKHFGPLGYSVAHSAVIYAYDASDRLPVVYPGGITPSDIVADLPVLAGD